MSGKSQEKQPAVRPGFLAITLFVFAGSLYWLYFMQPKPAPISPTKSTDPSMVFTPFTDTKIPEGQPELENRKLRREPNSTRDLFMPPPSIIAARRRKDSSNMKQISPVKQPVEEEPKLIKPDQGLLTAAKPDENPEKPILKGIMGTESSQVIIVRYQNKSYLLKLGEILPGTKYRVTEITDDSVILSTPKGRIKLDKKERAK